MWDMYSLFSSLSCSAPDLRGVAALAFPNVSPGFASGSWQSWLKSGFAFSVSFLLV